MTIIIWLSCFNCLKMCIIILFARQKVGETGTKTFLPLMHLPSAWNNQGWTNLKPGAQNPNQVFYMVKETQLLEASSAYFQDAYSQTSGIRVELGFKLRFYSNMGCDVLTATPIIQPKLFQSQQSILMIIMQQWNELIKKPTNL